MNYHDIPALNASGINAFYKSPLHYWKQSTFNPERERNEPTPAMVMGSLAHCLILEPESFDKEFILAPEINRRTNEGKAQWLAFQGKAQGKLIVTPEQYNQAIDMRDAMFANKAVAKLLGNGCSEQPVTWHRNGEGILCKAKLDYLRSGLLVDYKTTKDASLKGFSRSLANYGYYRQMAWYMEAAEVAYGERPRGAVLIVQDKSLPQAIGIYALKEDALELGAQECDVAHQEISKRLVTGKWEAYPEMIQEISLPFWFMKERMEERSYV